MNVPLFHPIPPLPTTTTQTNTKLGGSLVHIFGWLRVAAGLLRPAGHSHHSERREHGRQAGDARGGGGVHDGGDGADPGNGLHCRRRNGHHLFHEVRSFTWLN